jgi:hypothetical protein
VSQSDLILSILCNLKCPHPESESAPLYTLCSCLIIYIYITWGFENWKWKRMVFYSRQAREYDVKGGRVADCHINLRLQQKHWSRDKCWLPIHSVFENTGQISEDQTSHYQPSLRLLYFQKHSIYYDKICYLEVYFRIYRVNVVSVCDVSWPKNWKPSSERFFIQKDFS